MTSDKLQDNLNDIYFNEKGTVEADRAYEKILKEYKEKEKIIQELEHKLSVVLDYATDGEISKPYIDIQYIREAMNKKILREWERAIQDYREAVSNTKYSDRPKAPSEQETKST